MGIFDPRQYKSGVQYGGRRRQAGLTMTDQHPPQPTAARLVSRSQAREILAEMGLRDSDDQEAVMADLYNMTQMPNQYEYDSRSLMTAGKAWLAAKLRQEAAAGEAAQADLPVMESFSRGKFTELAGEQGISKGKVDEALKEGVIPGAQLEGKRWEIPYHAGIAWINANAGGED